MSSNIKGAICRRRRRPDNTPNEAWMPVSDKPQTWWRIVCTYDGKPGSIAAAVGSTADEAKTAFLDSLAEPHLAVIEEVSPIGVCEVTDVLEDLWG